MPLTLNTNTQVPIVSWATRPMTGEEQATACQVANAPFVQPHVALMADVHHSSGVLVGSVIPTKGVVYPSAVGRDIGCGMLARKLTLRADLFKPKKLARARAEIERLVAVGTNYHTNPEDDVLGWSGWDRFEQLHPEVRADHQRALTQMGTLGDGNHFIEICVEPDQGRESNIWVVLHSGSRGIGHQLGEIHFESAKIYTGQSGITVPNTFFSFLREGTSEFAAYWSDMQWAMDYAQANRAIMMARIISYFAELFQQDENSIVAQTIECVHNYVARERHFGEDVFITRKGAIRAG
ncbi:MAG TPA: RtcB family protein, partial [bacterium]|nr:RtcB family protein [bacterium]